MVQRGDETPAGALVIGAIDGFSVFRDAVSLRGWCISHAAPVAALEIRPPGYPDQASGRRFSPYWLPSPDVAAAVDAHATDCRFDITVSMGPHAPTPCGGSLAVILADGSEVTLGRLGNFRTSAASDLTERFFAMLGGLDHPNVLEVGSRARSGITRNDRLPAGARYTGCDIRAGENVDVVCDAHALSAALPRGHFRAVMAFSVIEHLLMPWKFVLELNTVMAKGGIGLFTTHQCWPIHDAPWDYWRFSDQAWKGLLNEATGFAVLGAAMGEPAYIVAADTHFATDFPHEPSGYLASNVLFQKIGETALRWEVDPAALVSAPYPA
jgi:hypothetical protein